MKQRRKINTRMDEKLSPCKTISTTIPLALAILAHRHSPRAPQNPCAMQTGDICFLSFEFSVVVGLIQAVSSSPEPQLSLVN